MNEVLKQVAPSIGRVINEYLPQLADKIRWDRYRAEWESRDQFVLLLGGDLPWLTHPFVVLSDAVTFMDYNEQNGVKISPLGRSLLMIAAVVHDWGELIVGGFGVGDVTLAQRTNNTEKVEAKVFNLIFNQIEDRLARKKLKVAYEDVAKNQESELGQMFHAIEQVGYLLTGIQAFEGKEIDGEVNRVVNYRGIVGSVLTNNLSSLMSVADKYPYVKKILTDNRITIRAMAEDLQGQQSGIDSEGQLFYDDRGVGDLMLDVEKLFPKAQVFGGDLQQFV